MPGSFPADLIQNGKALGTRLASHQSFKQSSCHISKNQISELLKLSKMYNYEMIASYWVVYKQRGNVVSFVSVNSEILLCMFTFCYAHSTLTFLRPFFRYARASVRTGSYVLLRMSKYRV